MLSKSPNRHMHHVTLNLSHNPHPKADIITFPPLNDTPFPQQPPSSRETTRAQLERLNARHTSIIEEFPCHFGHLHTQAGICATFSQGAPPFLTGGTGPRVGRNMVIKFVRALYLLLPRLIKNSALVSVINPTTRKPYTSSKKDINKKCITTAFPTSHSHHPLPDSK